MTHEDIRAAIAANPALVALVHAALAITGRAATPEWQAIGAAVAQGRTRRAAERRLNELSVRAMLPPAQAVPLLRTLREVHDAADTPAWLAAALDGMGIATAEHVIYLDTLQCGWRWLQSEKGLDVSNDTTRQMLALLKTVRPALADACDALTAAGDEAEHVDELDVRRAVLADDATVRV